MPNEKKKFDLEERTPKFGEAVIEFLLKRYGMLSIHGTKIVYQ